MGGFVSKPKKPQPDPALLKLEQERIAEENRRKESEALASVDERRAAMAGLRGQRTLLSAGYAGYRQTLGAGGELG